MMFQRILVPLDGSIRAERAVPIAACLARGSGGTITFVHVVSSPAERGSPGEERSTMLSSGEFDKQTTEAADYLTCVTHKYANDLSGINIKQEVDTGPPSSTLFSLALQKQSDLMILCSQKAYSLFRWAFGSLGHEAVRHSPVPLLLLNEAGSSLLEPCHGQPVRILVTLDGSVFSEAILQPAFQLVSALAAQGLREVHFLHVVDMLSLKGTMQKRAYVLGDEERAARKEAEVYLERIAYDLCRQMPEMSRPAFTWSVAASTDIAKTIVTVANPPEEAEQKRHYDLIAMATHGRSGFQRLMVGSVTERVLGSTRLPLLLVRPSQAEDQDKQTIEKYVRKL